MDPVLELRGISKRFSSHLAVDGISLEVERGAFYSLLGPSGCGKTTTLRLIAGFEEATEGEILLCGRRINELKPYERKLNTVFQNYALFPHLTVRGNIEFGLRRKGRGERAGMVANVLDMVHLTGKEDRYPSQLSGGERQRVALARSLVLQPDLLLLDEPLSALDPGLRKQVRSELKQLQRQLGTTFLFVTHDEEEALSISDRIAVMNGGRLEQTGTPEEIYCQPISRFAAEFLGAVNWIGGVGVRPEVTRISRDVPPVGCTSRKATVEHLVFLGHCFHVQARLASGEPLVAEVPRLSASYSTGDAVHVWWHASDELPISGASQ